MDQPRRLLLIINPISGTHDKDDIYKTVSSQLDSEKYQLAVHWTEGPGDATMKAREAAESGFYGVLVAGGDGTVNEVAIGIRGTDTAMGIIPCGSGNGMARHIGINTDVKAAIDVINEGHVASVDYGSVNDRLFLCTCGVGFDAAVSERFAREARRGRLSYIKSTLMEFMAYHPQEYQISFPDGTVITEKAFLVAICNASQYGNNAYIAPHASIRDGMLDITIVHSGSPLTTALVGVDLLTGFIDHNMLIDTFRAPALTITRHSAGPIHADGEPLDGDATLNVMCHHGGLRMFTPAREPKFMPLITPMQSFFNDLNADIRNILKGK